MYIIYLTLSTLNTSHYLHYTPHIIYSKYLTLSTLYTSHHVAQYSGDALPKEVYRICIVRVLYVRLL
jgi:hypothetical protein